MNKRDLTPEQRRKIAAAVKRFVDGTPKGLKTTIGTPFGGLTVDRTKPGKPVVRRATEEEMP